MTESRKFSIGEVQVHEHLCGDRRVDALKSCFKSNSVPQGFRLFVQGYGFVRASDVNWDTSGIPEKVEGGK